MGIPQLCMLLLLLLLLDQVPPDLVLPVLVLHVSELTLAQELLAEMLQLSPPVLSASGSSHNCGQPLISSRPQARLCHPPTSGHALDAFPRKRSAASTAFSFGCACTWQVCDECVGMNGGRPALQLLARTLLLQAEEEPSRSRGVSATMPSLARSPPLHSSSHRQGGGV